MMREREIKKVGVMKSKERVLTAIALQEPDRVPVGYVDCNTAIGARLREYFGTQDLDDALGSDFRRIGAPYKGPILHEEIKVVDTLQPEATDMSPAFLKERYGRKLAFHGCISTAGVLAYGTPDEVTRNVQETLEIMKPGSGCYILAPTHSIQDNTPVENVIAMFEAAKRYGVYGK